MIYGSVCSGIEAATVAWHALGWMPAWYSEIEAFPSRVLRHHYPAVTNLGDMMRLEENPLYNESAIDLLVGGTPCQSFSLAGLREGLASANGNLALQFCRILRQKRPTWFVWENVPGALSSYTDDPESKTYPGVSGSGGEAYDVVESADFATILRGFSECGYSLCWRVLDSQFFGVPQQRRRLFVVGHLGDDWRPPAAVLLEPHCMRGDSAPRKKAREELAGTLTASAGRSGGAGIQPSNLIAKAILAHHQRQNAEDNYIVMSSGQANASVMENVSPTLNTVDDMPIVAKWPADKANTLNAAFGDKLGLEDQHINSGAPLFVPVSIRTSHTKGNDTGVKTDGVTHTLGTSGNPHAIGSDSGIRCLTPLEFERLQGFPDHYTAIPKAADGARYRALGNSMPVPVMRWIGRRIGLVNDLLHPKQA